MAVNDEGLKVQVLSCPKSTRDGKMASQRPGAPEFSVTISDTDHIELSSFHLAVMAAFFFFFRKHFQEDRQESCLRSPNMGDTAASSSASSLKTSNDKSPAVVC